MKENKTLERMMVKNNTLYSRKPSFEPIYGMAFVEPDEFGVVRFLGRINRIVDKSDYVLGMPFIHDLARLPKKEENIEIERNLRTKDNREVLSVIRVYTTINDPQSFMKFSPDNYQEAAVNMVLHNLEQYIAEGVEVNELQKSYEEIARRVGQEVGPKLLRWGLESRVTLAGTGFAATEDLISIYRDEVQKNADTEGKVKLIFAKYEARVNAVLILEPGLAKAEVFGKVYSEILTAKAKTFIEIAPQLLDSDRVAVAMSIFSDNSPEIKQLMGAALKRVEDGYYGESIQRLATKAGIPPVIATATKVGKEWKK